MRSGIPTTERVAATAAGELLSRPAAYRAAIAVVPQSPQPVAPVSSEGQGQKAESYLSDLVADAIIQACEGLRRHVKNTGRPTAASPER